VDVHFLMGKRVEYRGRVGTGIGHHTLTEAFGKSVDISFPAADEKPAREKTVPSYLWFLVRILDD
jgi:hypothetical protein